ncbi:MAG TPA: DUF3618 domain-containing protein, partial [Longimicrobiaceae bacterium]|nr:DUF3618 domain-containing protein [Longimicrobiaceae bacterium]
MAEIRMDREGTTTPQSDVHRQENLTAAPADRLPSGHALPGGTPSLRTDPSAVAADDPQAVRAEIEQTRERMSGTIDEIEEVLARKKEQIQDRLDVMSPVRERPLPAAGIAFGAGLVLGLLTGGDDDDHDEREHRSRSRALHASVGMAAAAAADDAEWQERAELWENRARRLLRVAREQEEQIRDLQERYGSLYTRDVELRGWENDEEAAGELSSSIGSLRDNVLHGLTGFLTDAFRQMGGSGSSS